MNKKPPTYVGTREAAELLQLSQKTLHRYRISGEGPVFHKFGRRVRYALSDLEDWAATRRRTSTCDDGTALAGVAR